MKNIKIDFVPSFRYNHTEFLSRIFMKLTVLIDNNTIIDQYFLGEPGVSYLIEDEGKQILFDAGYSNAFLLNAQKMNLDMLQNDFIVLSHGHSDHTWGLIALLEKYEEAKKNFRPYKTSQIIAHSTIFNSKSENGQSEDGCSFLKDKLSEYFHLYLTKEPFWITKNLVFLGEIVRKNDFENQEPYGKVTSEKGIEDDFMLDDSALAYKSKEGLVIITGCSHSGICNIVEQAKKVCGENRIADIIGGFHLMKPSQKQLNGTLEYFRKIQPKELHACHCVDFSSKIELSKVANVKEVGVGLSLEYN